MTHAISVPTPFTDIAELAESFASRIDEERLMLPHHEGVPEGEWVQFTVTFADGTGALVGVGRCTGAYDNGEDRAAEHRFDIVMDSLDLDEMGQIYFERILQVRAAQMGAEPQTGELGVEEIEAAYAEEAVPVEAAPAEEYAPVEAAYEAPEEYDAGAYAAPVEEAAPVFEEAPAYEAPVADAAYEEAPAYEAAPAYDAAPAYEEAPAFDAAPAYEEPAAPEYDASADAASGWDDPGHTQIGEAAELLAVARGERLAAPVHAIYELPPPTAPGQLPSPHANGAVLTRRAVAATWSPEPEPRPDPSPSSGLFQYGDGGLPQPAQPPRPQLDPSLRVLRAPRPGDPLAVPMMRSAAVIGGAAAAVAVAYEEEAYAEQHAQPEYAEAGYEEGGELATQEGDAMAEEYPSYADEEGEYAELPDSAYGTAGEETLQVELPDDDEQR